MCIDPLDLRDQLDGGHGAWEQSAQERAWLSCAGSLVTTNPWLRDPAVRARMFALTVESSTAVEGVRVSLPCRCGHSALMHDSGGGCTLCPCRGFRG